VTAFTLSAGMPYTATVTVSYSGSRTLHYSFMGGGGYYTQLGSTNQFTFTPNESGGPYTDYVVVDDGCQPAWGTLAGIRTPPGDVSGATATAAKLSVALSWTNPSSANLDHVELSGSGFTTVSVAPPATTYTLTGLTGGQRYDITIKTVDDCGNRSTGVSVSATPTAFVTQAFTYTGAQQSFTVPAGVTSVSIDAYGAQGGNSGGLGGRATGALSVTPGQVLYVYVGGAGANGSGSGWHAGGFNGGGNGYSGGGGDQGGAGGGSGYVGGVTGGSMSSSVQSGDGEVVLTY
jgi:hypothetical protein